MDTQEQIRSNTSMALDDEYWNNLPVRWICSCGVSCEEPWKIVPKKCKNCGKIRGT